MKLEYVTDERGYLEYLINFTKVTSIGKEQRKRFYIGFSFIYLLIWVAIFVYVIYQNHIPTPYFIMSLVIYAVLMFNMIHFDVHESGAKRRALKDISTKRVILNQKIKMSFEKDRFEVAQGKEETSYKVKNILGMSETEHYIVIYVSEIKAYVLPKNLVTDEIFAYIEKTFERIEDK